MPPRYAYWTILIDQQPTAFRAREREELLPTLHQLRRKNSDVALKWFARGRLWESPAEAQEALRAPRPPVERRGRDWRPGGAHRDPRDRFKKRAKPAHRPHTPSANPDGERPPSAPRGKDQHRPKGFAPRGKSSGNRKPFSPQGKGVDARKSFAPRGPVGSRKPWQRDRPGPRRQPETAPNRRPAPPPMPPAADSVAAKRKPQEPE